MEGPVTKIFGSNPASKQSNLDSKPAMNGTFGLWVDDRAILGLSIPTSRKNVSMVKASPTLQLGDFTITIGVQNVSENS